MVNWTKFATASVDLADLQPMSALKVVRVITMMPFIRVSGHSSFRNKEVALKGQAAVRKPKPP